jgi:hypothetical protein
VGSRQDVLAVVLCILGGTIGCGGGSHATAPEGGATVTPTPTPTPKPSPSPPAVSAACQLTAPTVDCGTREVRSQELAPALQAGVDAAAMTTGVMYPDVPNRIYDLPQFRAKVIDTLTAAGLCGAWDYGNESGNEIYVRSADGCAIEQYGLIGSDGGARRPAKSSNVWSSGWGVPVPDPKPQFPRDGDLTCPLPGDRATFCFSIRNSPGAFGPDVYKLMSEVLNENPTLFDSHDFLPGRADFQPDLLRLPAWRIKDQAAYIRAVETKLRGRGYCAYVESGDILKLKSLANGNLFHEEIDIVQDPPDGGAYVSFAIKDRCHDAGF